MKSFLMLLLAVGTAATCGAAPTIEELRQRLENGDQQAAIALGMRYRDGRGVQRDYGEAVKWFRYCADKGNAEGMDNVGFMYLMGWGVPLNEGIAVAYFKAGAEGGNDQARYNLGTCYFSGRAVEQDYAAAIETWQTAAERRHDNSIWRLATLHAAGEHLPQDRRKALQLSQSIVERGHIAGMLLLGELHAQLGESEAARRCWKKAAGQGSDQAKALLELAKWRHQDPVAGSRAYVEVDHIYQGWNNCGATSMAMFARHGGSDATPYSIKRLCPQSPIGTGTDWEHLVAAGTSLGQRWELLAFSHDEAGFADGVKVIRNQLDQQHPVVIDFTVERRENGKVRRFGHTLLIVGYHTELDQFVLKNPNQPSPGIQLMTAGQLEANWVSGGYSKSAKGRLARPLIVMAKPVSVR